MDTVQAGQNQPRISEAQRELLQYVSEDGRDYNAFIPALEDDLDTFQEDYPTFNLQSELKALMKAGYMQKRTAYVITDEGAAYLKARRAEYEAANPRPAPNPYIAATHDPEGERSREFALAALNDPDLNARGGQSLALAIAVSLMPKPMEKAMRKLLDIFTATNELPGEHEKPIPELSLFQNMMVQWVKWARSGGEVEVTEVPDDLSIPAHYFQ